MTSPLERLDQYGENQRQIGPHETVSAPNVAFKFQHFKFTRFLVINELKIISKIKMVLFTRGFRALWSTSFDFNPSKEF